MDGASEFSTCLICRLAPCDLCCCSPGKLRAPNGGLLERFIAFVAPLLPASGSVTASKAYEI